MKEKAVIMLSFLSTGPGLVLSNTFQILARIKTNGSRHRQAGGRSRVAQGGGKGNRFLVPTALALTALRSPARWRTRLQGAEGLWTPFARGQRSRAAQRPAAGERSRSSPGAPRGSFPGQGGMRGVSASHPQAHTSLAQTLTPLERQRTFPEIDGILADAVQQ